MEPVSLSVLLGVTVLLPLLIVLWWIWRKGRPIAKGEVFRASRLSGGNRLFPTQVAITPQSVVHYTPQWIGKHEHSIHMAHVASVSIDTGLLFSDVDHRDERWVRIDPLPRAPQGRRGAHEAADRGAPDVLLPRRRTGAAA